MAEKLGKALVPWILNWIWGKIYDAVAKLWGFIMRQKQAEERSAETTEPLKQAKTGQEISDATRSALDGL